ncbi:hypothetical protein [Arthrobacter sp. U41]|uniref:hypothetical protein n=1 Tax=Arthrobacter sp. U41 TaxID=1849032 RepID=UPI0008594397|nr:hypothetical protein [Arthrobacter sp. U41]AOT02026.1 hypothetical protein ASPU41_00430 [Arthrobacter sp. U41]
MKDTSYRWMTKRQAAAALQEYLAERPAALQLLRAELTAHGLDPDPMLDGTTASLIPLWRWIAARLLTQPPDAAWQVGYHRIKAYHLQNHPVLTSPHTDMEIFLPVFVTVIANRLRSGMDPLREDQFSSYAGTVITGLRGEENDAVAAPAASEPLVEVDVYDEVFDVGLREDLAHEHSRMMDRMITELRAQPGVASAFREDREVLLVGAPEWTVGELEQWLLAWSRRHVRDLG